MDDRCIAIVTSRDMLDEGEALRALLEDARPAWASSRADVSIHCVSFPFTEPQQEAAGNASPWMGKTFDLLVSLHTESELEGLSFGPRDWPGFQEAFGKPEMPMLHFVISKAPSKDLLELWARAHGIADADAYPWLSYTPYTDLSLPLRLVARVLERMISGLPVGDIPGVGRGGSGRGVPDDDRIELGDGAAPSGTADDWDAFPAHPAHPAHPAQIPAAAPAFRTAPAPAARPGTSPAADLPADFDPFADLMAPPGFGLPSAAPTAQRTPAIQRSIDARLLGGPLRPGAEMTLQVTLRLPASRTSGQWQAGAQFDPHGKVRIALETQGWTLLTAPPASFDLDPDHDSAPVAFELRADEAAQRWLHVLVTQHGRLCGELVITDFSAFGAPGSHTDHHAGMHGPCDADLLLVVRAGETSLEASSPWDRAALDHAPIGAFQYPDEGFRARLAQRLRGLYALDGERTDIEREMQLLGIDLAECLPPRCRELLRRPDIRTVMLRHPPEFEFPLELCYLDDPDFPFFVGDRMAVCRWYLGVSSPPFVLRKDIHRVAYLKGAVDACAQDQNLLETLFPHATVTLGGRSEVLSRLLATDDFDLIHFTGHCSAQDSEPGLELEDGSHLQVGDVGKRLCDRKFGRRNPFVMLNACATARPQHGLTQRESFTHSFVEHGACAVLGTLWPVSEVVANAFAQRFYLELGRGTVAAALLAAKRALLDRSGADSSAAAAGQRAIAARSYCLFGNPDLQLHNL